MHWIAPSEKDTNNVALEKRLWDAAGQAVPAPYFAETDFNSARPEGLHGVEKTDETGRLCRLVAVRKDFAVHGLEGQIKHGGNINSYYDDPLDHGPNRVDALSIASYFTAQVSQKQQHNAGTLGFL